MQAIGLGAVLIRSTSRFGRGRSWDRGQLAVGDRLGLGGVLLVGGRVGEEMVEAASQVSLQ